MISIPQYSDERTLSMNDPFRPEANPQLMREARVGLTLLAITLGLFSYVAYHKLMGSGTKLPDHVVNAPIATAVWPGDDPTQMAAQAKRVEKPEPVARQFGSLLASAKQTLGIGKPKKSNRLFEKPRDYSDPLPQAKSEPLPKVKMPHRVEPSELEMAEVAKSAAKRDIDSSFVSRIAPNIEPASLPSVPQDLRGENGFASTVGLSTPTKERSQTRRRPRPIQFEPNHLAPSQTQTRIANVTRQSLDESFSQRPTELVAAESLRPRPVPEENQFSSRTPNFELEQKNVTPASTKVTSNSRNKVTSDMATELAGTPKVSSNLSQDNSFTSRANLPLRDSHTAKASFESKPIKSEPANSTERFVDTTKSIKNSSDFGVPRAESKKGKAGILVEPSLQSEGEHTVLAGESFWSIAQKQYDDGRYFRALFEYNRKRVGTFENLAPGAVIATPKSAELAKLWPELCPKPDGSNAETTDVDERVYVTREGDTLFGIARQKLDQASRYLEIMEMNQFSLPRGVSHLSPLAAGTRLVLPMNAN